MMGASGESGQRYGACWAKLDRWAGWVVKERWGGESAGVTEG
jgi:hypothetical protein